MKKNKPYGSKKDSYSKKRQRRSHQPKEQQTYNPFEVSLVNEDTVKQAGEIATVKGVALGLKGGASLVNLATAVAKDAITEETAKNLISDETKRKNLTVDADKVKDLTTDADKGQDLKTHLRLNPSKEQQETLPTYGNHIRNRKAYNKHAGAVKDASTPYVSSYATHNQGDAPTPASGQEMSGSEQSSQPDRTTFSPVGEKSSSHSLKATDDKSANSKLQKKPQASVFKEDAQQEQSTSSGLATSSPVGEKSTAHNKGQGKQLQKRQVSTPEDKLQSNKDLDKSFAKKVKTDSSSLKTEPKNALKIKKDHQLNTEGGRQQSGKEASTTRKEQRRDKKLEKVDAHINEADAFAAKLYDKRKEHIEKMPSYRKTTTERVFDDATKTMVKEKHTENVPIHQDKAKHNNGAVKRFSNADGAKEKAKVVGAEAVKAPVKVPYHVGRQSPPQNAP